VQGVPPHGTNPDGNGHLELLDPFNEHVSGETVGGPAEVAEPVQLASTGSYVLLPSEKGWVPALDLSDGNDFPLPLSSLPNPPRSPLSSPAPTVSNQQVVGTVGPNREALLGGTPVVVGTVVADVTLPRADSAGGGTPGGKVGDRVLLMLALASLGLGLILWAASYMRKERKGSGKRQEGRE